jgi:hypothetical protein
VAVAADGGALDRTRSEMEILQRQLSATTGHGPDKPRKGLRVMQAVIGALEPVESSLQPPFRSNISVPKGI